MRVKSNESIARRRATKRERRGGTIVLVAVVMTVLIMFGGWGIDFARMYAFQAQLKVLTDAAAHAAAIEIQRNGTEANAKTRALALKTYNQVEGTHTATMDDTNITPGTWNASTRTFTATAWASATAVRARARYTANWSLARIFGVSQRTLMQQSVAALGAIGSSSCLKPWAVPYSNMLQTLGRSPTDTAYRLTSTDVANLRANQTPIAFKISSGNSDNGGATVGGTLISGNYYAVKYGPVQFANGTSGTPASGGNNYRDNIADTGCNSTGAAAVGDWLDMENGNMVGPTGDGMRTFCGISGNPKKFNCSKSVVMPIWNQQSTGSGNAWVKILYIGAFQLTEYDDGVVTGYLTALNGAGSGGFTPSPGPVSKAAIVD